MVNANGEHKKIPPLHGELAKRLNDSICAARYVINLMAKYGYGREIYEDIKQNAHNAFHSNVAIVIGLSEIYEQEEAELVLGYDNPYKKIELKERLH